MKTDSLQAAEWYLDFQVLACERLLDTEPQKINQSFTINSHQKVRCNFECDQFCHVGLTSLPTSLLFFSRPIGCGTAWE
jgi:hypothetical protein